MQLVLMLGILMRSVIIFILGSSLLLILFASPAHATWVGWEWDWDVRTDGYGEPAGYFTGDTPFPVDENDSTWTITNEDGDKVFTVGTMAFVDNSTTSCSNGDGDYEPSTRTCGAGSETVYTTLSNGSSGLGSGNKTLLIRGGQTYTNINGWSLPSGTDSRHMFSAIGYAQERPILDGGAQVSAEPRVINMSSNTLIQRLQIQQGDASNVHLKTTNAYLIDIYSYHGNDETTEPSDGSMVATNSNFAWFYHVTVEKTENGHCIKMSDGAEDSLIEFSYVTECGYYSGKTESDSGHPSGFDYPDVGTNHELRYSRGITSLFYMVQVRGNLGYDANGVGLIQIHDNEFADATHFDDVTGESGHVAANLVLLFSAYQGKTPSNTLYFYNNIVRDASDSGAYGIYLTDAHYDNAYIYNNLFYGNDGTEIYLNGSTGTGPVHIFNNSFYDDSGTLISSGVGTDLDMKNNTFYADGATCLSVGTGTHTYNRYYYPSGSRGVTLGTGEVDGDPNWVAIPSGTYGATDMRLQATDAGTDLSSGEPFSTTGETDFLYFTRSSWDRGAKEYDSGAPAETDLNLGTFSGTGSFQ